ncbi:MAG: DUF1957 domain-containing protein [Nitrospinae bacterium]|nr:DUF1957 domain-containing protein [Nitrospinota bacterium]
MADGLLALLLHAHLPFVRHPEHEVALEEDWLFEALTETYLPLLDIFDRLDGEQVPCRLTVTLSPTLIEMLNDPLLRERYERSLERLIELAEKEVGRTGTDPAVGPLARMYLDRFTAARAWWLPECGYQPGIEALLAGAGVKYFFLDAHGLLHGDPRPRRGVFAPAVTPEGVAVFGRDMESSRQVWSAKVGYPGDPDYRDFYRDIGFDLPMDYIGPYVQPTGHRKMTGIKYHRVTGGADDKDVYDRGAAMARVRAHAADFLLRRAEQTARVAPLIDRPPLIVSPYDAELFGHWWFEGPEFLEAVIRSAAWDGVELVTPRDYLNRFPDNQELRPAASTWGLRGYSEMWLDESNDWIYRHLHKAAERMTELARAHPRAQGVTLRALNQAARELMLAQSSDWAFIMKSGSMTAYAQRRVKESLLEFTRLFEEIAAGRIDERALARLEARDNLFAADVDYRDYLP